jgi:hypothetical protein
MTSRTLQTRQRYGSDLSEVSLEWDPQARRVSLGTPRKERDDAEAAGKILDFLRPRREFLSEPEICRAIGGNKVPLSRALRKLVDEGKVSKKGGGKRSDPYLYSIGSNYLVASALARGRKGE